MRRLRRARHRRVHDEARANKGRGKKLLWSLTGFSISRGTVTGQFACLLFRVTHFFLSAVELLYRGGC